MINRKIEALVPGASFSVWYGPLPFLAETDESADYVDHGEYILAWHKSNVAPCPSKAEITAAVPVVESKTLTLESLVEALKIKGTLNNADIEAAKK